MNGNISNVWFDRFKISNDCPEHIESIDVMCKALSDLIDEEVRSGIKKNRILIGKTFKEGGLYFHFCLVLPVIILRRSVCILFNSLKDLYINVNRFRTSKIQNHSIIKIYLIFFLYSKSVKTSW